MYYSRISISKKALPLHGNVLKTMYEFLCWATRMCCCVISQCNPRSTQRTIWYKDEQNSWVRTLEWTDSKVGLLQQVTLNYKTPRRIWTGGQDTLEANITESKSTLSTVHLKQHFLKLKWFRIQTFKNCSERGRNKIQ